jgi:hypothetical protein
VREIASPISGDRDDADVARHLHAWVGWIESVITSSLSLEPAMRAAPRRLKARRG